MPLSYTSEQIINKAASDLGKYVPGEALGPIEHQVISDALDAVLEEIAKIIAIGDRDEIPAMLFESISILTAMFAASSFSNVPVDYNQVERIEQRMRYLIAQTPTYEPLKVFYF